MSRLVTTLATLMESGTKPINLGAVTSHSCDKMFPDSDEYVVYPSRYFLEFRFQLPVLSFKGSISWQYSHILLFSKEECGILSLVCFKLMKAIFDVTPEVFRGSNKFNGGV